MLEAVEINDASDSKLLVKLPMTETDSSVPYYIKDIEGLGPVKADIHTNAYAAWDGEVYHGSRVGMRNIVMTVGYRPDYVGGQSVESLRRILYSHLHPKAEVTLRLRGGYHLSETLKAKAFVESHEPAIFSKEPEVQISFICPDPHFSSVNEIYSQGDSDTPIDVAHLGTADTGFRLEVFGNPNVEYIFIGNGVDTILRWRGSMTWDQSLHISTERGNKYARLISRGSPRVTLNVLDGITQGGLSMTLGANKSRLTVLSAPKQTMIYTLRTTPKWVGF